MEFDLIVQSNVILFVKKYNYFSSFYNFMFATVYYRFKT